MPQAADPIQFLDQAQRKSAQSDTDPLQLQKKRVADNKISGKASPKQGYSTSVEISKRHICIHSIKTQMTSISSSNSFSK